MVEVTLRSEIKQQIVLMAGGGIADMETEPSINVAISQDLVGVRRLELPAGQAVTLHLRISSWHLEI